MPTKNAEKIAQVAVYIDGKPIKRIQRNNSIGAECKFLFLRRR